MRIAVLPPFPDGAGSAIENYFQLFAVRQLLAEHDLVRVNGPTDDSFDFHLFLGERFLEDGFWDKWILGGSKKIAALGVAVDPARKWDARASEKLRAIAKGGGVS